MAQFVGIIELVLKLMCSGVPESMLKCVLQVQLQLQCRVHEHLSGRADEITCVFVSFLQHGLSDAVDNYSCFCIL